MEPNKRLPEAAPLLVTAGDPAGVGPELLQTELPKFYARTRTPLLVFATGGADNLIGALRAQAIKVERLSMDRPDVWPATGFDGVRVVDVAASQPDVVVQPGVPSPTSGQLAFRALEQACDVALARPVRGLVTLPLSKEWVVRSGVTGFHGHTDYLGERFGCATLMLMHGRELSAIPLTVHIPLGAVSRELRRVLYEPALFELLQRVRNLGAYRNGPWALCGLNPHAGEGGELGREELDFLNERADAMRSAGLPVEGPFPADALFFPERRARYRLALACYHDQGLIPFKALEGAHGVNVTIGLPIVRTSPDHGTAFDIAGRNCADPRSFCAALECAVSGELDEGGAGANFGPAARME